MDKDANGQVNKEVSEEMDKESQLALDKEANGQVISIQANNKILHKTVLLSLSWKELNWSE